MSAAKYSYMRVWKNVELEKIEPELLMVGTISCDCAKCREAGIPLDAKKCPKCGTTFRYLSSRHSSSIKEAKRLKEKRPDLELIEYKDFKEVQARRKARGIFFSILLGVLVFIFGFSESLSFAGIADDIIPMSSDKEIIIGANLAKQVEKQFNDVDDPLVQKRFEDIGRRLVKVCDRQDLVYHFKVLKAKEETDEYLNAFTLPGGYIYIFDRLLNVMETDDKIAAVTAHELAHNSARHHIKRMQGNMGASLLMVLAVATAKDGRELSRANEALGHLMSAYSREDEFEADRLSVKYMKKADFDPNGVVESLETLKGIRIEGKERKYMYFKGHPYLSERIAEARSAVSGYQDFNSYINLPKNEDGYY